MSKRSRSVALVLFACIAFALSACASSAAELPPPTAASSTAAAATVPAVKATETSAGTGSAGLGDPANDCKLVTRHDIAGFFSGETSQPEHQVGPAAQGPFAGEKNLASESSCLYYSYNQSALRTGHSYQVTFWVDRPNGASPDEWSRAWTTARSGAAQSVAGIGDSAFYDNGILTFKKGNLYVSISVVRMDANPDEGAGSQLDVEKKIALTALSRMK